MQLLHTVLQEVQMRVTEFGGNNKHTPKNRKQPTDLQKSKDVFAGTRALLIVIV